MPGNSGFELLNRVEAKFKTVFVTAFDEHAIRAFEVNALDYLLKPVNPDRLAQAIERLSYASAVKGKAIRAFDYDDHLFMAVGDQPRFIKIRNIKCICAAGIYSEVCAADGIKTLVHRPLSEWEERLPAKQFLRIHRSTIINIEYVEQIKKWFNYSYQVQVHGIAKPFVMSRRYGVKLKDALG